MKSKSVHSRIFGLAVPLALLGGTIAYHRTLSNTTAQSGWYYHLTTLKDRAQAVPLLDKVGTTAGSNNCRRYHRLTRAVLLPRIPKRTSLLGGATAGQEF